MHFDTNPFENLNYQTMAFSKADHYAQDEQMVSNYFKSLGHPARLRILKKLKQDGILTVEEIRHGHPIAESTVSNHLFKVRVVGFGKATEEYPYTYYDIDLEEIKKAKKMINNFFDYLLGE